MIAFDPRRPRGIVWLASYPKSGNTWVRAFLDALLRITRGEQVDSVDINRMDQFRRSANDVQRFEKYLSGPADRVDRSEIARARAQVQADIVAESEGLVLVKTHNALMPDRGAPAINLGVSAGAIYIVRNPLDVAVSFAAFVSKPLDQMIDELATPGWGSGTNAKEVYYVTGSWSENVASWTAASNPVVLVVRYEDMLDRPQEAFGAIAAHIRSGASPEQVARAVELSSFKALQQTEQTTGFVETPDTASLFFRAGRAGQWRDAMSEGQVRRLTASHRQQMQRFGYAQA